MLEFSPEKSPATSPRKTIQEIHNEEQENLKRADPKKALIYVESHSLRKKSGDSWVKYPLNCDISEFGQYGVGLLLYFNFLKKMAIIFTILSIISIPSLISNCIGEGLDASNSKLLITTLANQPKLKVVVPAGLNLTTVQTGSTEYYELISANTKAMNDYKEVMDRNILLVAIPDLLYSIAFFVFIVYLRVNSRLLIETISRQSVMVPDFAAEVKGFPSNVTNPDNLIKHFQEFGEVLEVVLARNYSNTLMYNRRQAVLENKVIIEQKRIEFDANRSNKRLKKLKAQRNYLVDKIEKKLVKKNLAGKEHDDYPSLKAYVVFEDSIIANKTIKDYKNYWRYTLTRIFCNCFWDIRKTMPSKFKYMGEYPLVVRKTTAPSDILWENLDATKGESFLRKLTSGVIVFFLMLLTFIIIFAAQMQGTPSTTTCSSTLTKASIQGASNEIVDCYCSQFNTGQVFIDADLRSDCYNYALKIAGFQALSVASSLIIVLVNFLLKWVLVKLGKFERYHTLTEETLSSMMKVFVAMFFNTACITLLISARFGGESGDNAGIVIARQIGYIIPAIGKIIEENQNQYPNDLDRLWYTNVGNKIIYTWIINVISPHVVYFLMIPFINCMRKKSAKQSFIQKDMNLFSVGPSFLMISKYALALNTVFVTLFYCSGMPILLFFGAASLFLQYWVEKYLILRVYARPPNYNHDINTITLRIIPAALILHLALAVYTYGSEDIFLKQIKFPTFGNGNGSAQFSSTITDFNELLGERIKKVIYCFVALILLAIFYVLDLSIFRLISKVWKMFLQKNNVKVSMESNKTKFHYNLNQLKQQGITTYEIRGNAIYRDLVQSIDSKLIEKHQTIAMPKTLNPDELIRLKEPAIMRKI